MERQIDPALVRLVEELSEAEAQSLNDEGPIINRFHSAIVALCEYVGTPNRWEIEVEADRAARSN